MGAANAKAAFANWAHIAADPSTDRNPAGKPARPLSDPAVRILVFMALVSLDDDRPPRYFGGVAALAFAIGRNPTERSQGEVVFSDADLRAVRRAITELRDWGAIDDASSIGRAPGRPANYALRVTESPVITRPVSTGRRASGDGREHRTLGGRDTGRPMVEHRTPHGRTPDAGRPQEEPEEPEEHNEEHPPHASMNGDPSRTDRRDAMDAPPITDLENLVEETTDDSRSA
jgi:hypothetical protein